MKELAKFIQIFILTFSSLLHAQGDTTFFRSFNLHAREIGVSSVVESNSYYYVFFDAKFHPGGSLGMQPHVGIYDKEGFLLDYYSLFPFSVVWSQIYTQGLFRDRYILALDMSEHTNPNNGPNGLILLDMHSRSIVWRNNFRGWLIATNDSVVTAVQNYFNRSDTMKLGFINLNNGSIIKSISIDSLIHSLGLDPSSYRISQQYTFGDTLVLRFNNVNSFYTKLLLSFKDHEFFSYKVITDSAVSRFYNSDKNFEVSLQQIIIDSTEFSTGYFNYCRNFILAIHNKINNNVNKINLSDVLSQKCLTINNFIFNSDSTFTILYTYSKRMDFFPTHYCLANINLNGEIEWCMDYGLPFGRNYISNLRKSIDGGYFFIHSLGQLQALCKTDKKGKIYDSDFGVTYTRSNCENVKVLEKPDIPTDFILFPNPSNSHITILSKNKLILKVFSVEGKYLGTYNLTEFESQIDISYLKSGMYFFVLFDEFNEYIKTEKIIKL